MYEGPFWPGKSTPFVLPEVPTEEDKILAVVCACEGGSYSAINMYDGPPVLSSGLIQFIEGRYFVVGQMIAHALARSKNAAEGFYAFMEPRGYSLSRKNGGAWFFFDYNGTRIDTVEKQNSFFRGGTDGTKGTWGDNQKNTAKDWAAAVATVWEDAEAQKAQREFTLERLKQFAVGSSQRMVKFAENNNSPIAQAFVAAYISFAVNNPTRANKHLGIVADRYGGFRWKWDKKFFVEVMKELTFGPKIAIYPHRYNAIRPVLEKLYSVDLPDFAEELERWKEETGLVAISTEELQKALLSLGADLGPCGADGKYGKKTRDALLSFELTHGVPREHCDGMLDEFTAPALEKALLEAGVTLLGESS